MKFAITGDNHLDFVSQPVVAVMEFNEGMARHMPDLNINLGDMTNGRIYDQYPGLDDLMSSQWTFYVPGNHDLWSPPFCKQRTPDEAFRWVIRSWEKYAARPLEKSFSDRDTFWQNEKLDCALVGAMGFPDFEHPRHAMPKKYYETHHCTNDGRYIDLSLGWLRYTERIKKAFNARLETALSFGRKDIIIATHYPIFEGQYRLDGSDISAFFFCHGMGRHIIEVAIAHPEMRFWCVAAHAHEYCKGKLSVELDNVASYGLDADYGRLTFAIIDTSKGFDQKVKTEWFPGRPHVPVIETVEREQGEIP